ncbi:hypothetical protein MAHJHV64_02470 [Mycobacterium avium subsp. hominissuis]|jgi:hypothetical protein|nr:hypothetical protein I549_0022 [Mycobacterium avium subsp. avium 2285 (R)]KDP09633.1 hypothetical protein MAV101_00490 [Mycobacterium avium subsp. hominissuis 101]KDP11741.1 hypothetical protein MAV100_00490 [Mycobacterium avium subsp. hominissuis 100]
MTSGHHRSDEDAIRALIDRQEKAWAAGDPEGYASVFTMDADYVTFWAATTRDAKPSRHRTFRCSESYSEILV